MFARIAGVATMLWLAMVSVARFMRITIPGWMPNIPGGVNIRHRQAGFMRRGIR